MEHEILLDLPHKRIFIRFFADVTIEMTLISQSDISEAIRFHADRSDNMFSGWVVPAAFITCPSYVNIIFGLVTLPSRIYSPFYAQAWLHWEWSALIMFWFSSLPLYHDILEFKYGFFRQLIVTVTTDRWFFFRDGLCKFWVGKVSFMDGLNFVFQLKRPRYIQYK